MTTQAPDLYDYDAPPPEDGQWMWVPNEPPTPPRRPNRASRALVAVMAGIILLIVVVLGVAGGLWLASGHTNLETDAEAACMVAVNAQLKAPATADYSALSTTHNGNAWKVVGTVDSENSFGAKLRSTFGCALTYHPDTKAFTVDVALVA